MGIHPFKDRTAFVTGGASGVFVVDARVNPDLEADWYRDAFASDG